LLFLRKEAGLGAATEKTKYVFMSREQEGGQNRNIKLANSSLKMWKSLNIWE